VDVGGAQPHIIRWTAHQPHYKICLRLRVNRGQMAAVDDAIILRLAPTTPRRGAVPAGRWAPPGRQAAGSRRPPTRSGPAPPPLTHSHPCWWGWCWDGRGPKRPHSGSRHLRTRASGPPCLWKNRHAVRIFNVEGKNVWEIGFHENHFFSFDEIEITTNFFCYQSSSKFWWRNRNFGFDFDSLRPSSTTS
jgi:hypothetical protein